MQPSRDVSRWPLPSAREAAQSDKVEVMTDRREQIRARLEKATKGPWQSSLPGRDDAHMCRISTAWTQDGCFLQLGETWDPKHPVSYVGLSRQQCVDNAALIAAAPEDIAYLLAELDAGEALRKEDEAKHCPECGNYHWDHSSRGTICVACDYVRPPVESVPGAEKT
jgi:hypothetical protein